MPSAEGAAALQALDPNNGAPCVGINYADPCPATWVHTKEKFYNFTKGWYCKKIIADTESRVVDGNYEDSGDQAADEMGKDRYKIAEWKRQREMQVGVFAADDDEIIPISHVGERKSRKRLHGVDDTATRPYGRVSLCHLYTTKRVC